MINRIPGWIVFVLSTLITLAVFVQAYLITAYVTGGGQSALDAHGTVGFITHLVEVVVFLVAIWAWWRAWKWLGFVFLLPLIGTVQLALAPAEDGDTTSGWVHGFHGLLALIVLVLAAVIAHRSMRELGLKRGRAGHAGGGTAPPLP